MLRQLACLRLGLAPVGLTGLPTGPRRRHVHASRLAHTVTCSNGSHAFVATSRAAWSSFSVHTSRTTMIGPSRSIVQPDCAAASSRLDGVVRARIPRGALRRTAEIAAEAGRRGVCSCRSFGPAATRAGTRWCSYEESPPHGTASHQGNPPVRVPGHRVRATASAAALNRNTLTRAVSFGHPPVA